MRIPACHLALVVTWLLVQVGCQPGVPPQTSAAPNAAAAAVEESAEPTSPTDPNGGAANQETSSTMSIEKTAFGKTNDGQAVDLYTIQNKNGLVVKLMNYGATVVSVETPDKVGKLANITLSFDKLDGFLKRHPFFGSTVGRYANRIANGKFKIGEEEFTLATNDGKHHLHGGKKGFDAVVWQAEEVRTQDSAGVKFSYASPDGEEGYPGTLNVTATYRLTNNDELIVEYSATTDKPTVVNLTNHCYWNLGGAGSGDVLDHEMMISADKYLPVDEGSIPTGELAPVEGTPMDFTKATAIGARIKELTNEPQGYDHCYVLRGQGGSLELAARVKDPKSGRVMEIFTTEPGVQFYSGNYLNGSEAGNGYKKHEGFCLETQHFPDSPNQPTFPSTQLEADGEYKSKTVHKFSVEK